MWHTLCGPGLGHTICTNALRLFFAGLRSYSNDAHNDLKQVIKAWRALKPLQAAGLLSGYSYALRLFSVANRSF